MKNIMLSPHVLGCMIVCIFFLKLVFYILYYEKKSNTFRNKNQNNAKAQKNKIDKTVENTDNNEADEIT